MARKFEQIPTDAFNRIVFGAGVILTSFDPNDTVSKGTALDKSNILCITDGGVSITATPEYIDMADGLDNCPSNTKELKRLKQYTVTMSGTAKTIDETMTNRLLGATTEIDGTVSGLIGRKPAYEISSSDDFHELWWVGDYGATNGGFVAIKIINALSTGGFSLQSSDGDKGSFSFSFTGHYSIDNNSTAPIEIYMTEVAAELAGS